MNLIPVILCAALVLTLALVELRAAYADALERGTPPWPRVPRAMLMALVGAAIAKVVDWYGHRPPEWALWAIAGAGALVMADAVAVQLRRERRIEQEGGLARWLVDLNKSGRVPRKEK